MIQIVVVKCLNYLGTFAHVFYKLPTYVIEILAFYQKKVYGFNVCIYRNYQTTPFFWFYMWTNNSDQFEELYKW